MKNLVFYGLAIFLMYAFTFSSDNAIINKIDSDFMVKINGSSNVHDWYSIVEGLNGDAIIIVNDEGVLNIESCVLTMPVKSIKSEKGSIMDKKTRKALKEKEYPNIEFVLKSFEIVDLGLKNFKTTANGDLKVAGVTRSIDLQVTGNYLSDNSIEIKGSKNLKMTDFNINPPTALLGAMKTKDDVNIEFRIKLKTS